MIRAWLLLLSCPTSRTRLASLVRTPGPGPFKASSLCGSFLSMLHATRPRLFQNLPHLDLTPRSFSTTANSYLCADYGFPPVPASACLPTHPRGDLEGRICRAEGTQPWLTSTRLAGCFRFFGPGPEAASSLLGAPSHSYSSVILLPHSSAHLLPSALNHPPLFPPHRLFPFEVPPQDLCCNKIFFLTNPRNSH